MLFVGSWDFNYSAVARTQPRLWHNPWAADGLTIDPPFAASRVAPDEGSIENTEVTVSPAELFDLAPDWPGVPFEPR
jgi:hypothetical protein